MLVELVQGGELFSVMHPGADLCCLPAQVKFYMAIADAPSICTAASTCFEI
jgi:hypothetical protein